MTPLDLNISTVVVLAVLIVLMALAVRRMVRRGMCDSGGSCDGCKQHAAGGECPTCSAVNNMVANLEKKFQQ